MSKETKDQQPSSEFTAKLKKRWLAEAPHTDSTLDYAICAIIGLCDRLDTSEQQRDDLLEALKNLLEIDMYRDEFHDAGRAVIAKAEKEG